MITRRSRCDCVPHVEVDRGQAADERVGGDLVELSAQRLDQVLGLRAVRRGLEGRLEQDLAVDHQRRRGGGHPGRPRRRRAGEGHDGDDALDLVDHRSRGRRVRLVHHDLRRAAGPGREVPLEHLLADDGLDPVAEEVDVLDPVVLERRHERREPEQRHQAGHPRGPRAVRRRTAPRDPTRRAGQAHRRRARDQLRGTRGQNSQRPDSGRAYQGRRPVALGLQRAPPQEREDRRTRPARGRRRPTAPASRQPPRRRRHQRPRATRPMIALGTRSSAGQQRQCRHQREGRRRSPRPDPSPRFDPSSESSRQSRPRITVAALRDHGGRGRPPGPAIAAYFDGWSCSSSR